MTYAGLSFPTMRPNDECPIPMPSLASLICGLVLMDWLVCIDQVDSLLVEKPMIMAGSVVDRMARNRTEIRDLNCHKHWRTTVSAGVPFGIYISIQTSSVSYAAEDIQCIGLYIPTSYWWVRTIHLQLIADHYKDYPLLGWEVMHRSPSLGILGQTYVDHTAEQRCFCWIWSIARTSQGIKERQWCFKIESPTLLNFIIDSPRTSCWYSLALFRALQSIRP